MTDIVIQPDDSYIDNFVDLIEECMNEKQKEQEEQNNG